MDNDKRGLTPLKAGILLGVVIIILLTVIFIWAKGINKESITKFNTPIEDSCEKVVLVFEARSGNLYISNDGEIALYGIEMSESGMNNVIVPFESSLVTGKTGQIEIPSGFEAVQMKIQAVLVGESGNSKKSYTCNKKYTVNAV